MEPLAGLEPATNGLKAQRTNQLCYNGTYTHYTYMAYFNTRLTFAPHSEGLQIATLPPTNAQHRPTTITTPISIDI